MAVVYYYDNEPHCHDCAIKAHPNADTPNYFAMSPVDDSTVEGGTLDDYEANDTCATCCHSIGCVQHNPESFCPVCHYQQFHGRLASARYAGKTTNLVAFLRAACIEVNAEQTNNHAPDAYEMGPNYCDVYRYAMWFGTFRFDDVIDLLLGLEVRISSHDMRTLCTAASIVVTNEPTGYGRATAYDNMDSAVRAYSALELAINEDGI